MKRIVFNSKSQKECMEVIEHLEEAGIDFTPYHMDYVATGKWALKLTLRTEEDEFLFKMMYKSKSLLP